MVKVLGKCLPTDGWVRAALAPGLVFIALAADHNYLADFWHHLARGRAIVNQGRIVDEDLFTFTVSGRHFQDVNWLTQVLYYRLFAWGGLDLVRVINALVLAVTMGLLVGMCPRKSGSIWPGAVVGTAVFFGIWQVLTIRPQTFSLLFFVLVYDFLNRSEERPFWLVPIPAILALWANVHGAFPAGLMLIGCFLAAAAWDGWRKKSLLRHAPLGRLALCLGAGLGATLINPYGWKIYQYVGLTSNTAAVRRIDEWVAPGLDLWIGKAWLASLLIVGMVVAAAWCRGRRPTAREVVLTACFLPLACGSVRMVPWWLLVAGPMAAACLATLKPVKADNPPGTEGNVPTWGAGLAFVVILAAAFLSLPGLQNFNPLLAARRTAPRVEDDLEAIHARLGRHPPPRIFTRFEWGEYLTWAFSPRSRVFMDGRIEIYPDEVWDGYAGVTTGRQDWQKILDAYGVDVLLLDEAYHARTGLLPRVEKSVAWQRVFQSGPAILFVRKPGGGV